mmetsp:Transcript_14141/g.36290  ORF Transcript_14141/g.36290 Transcript_14141/m.36290 type:complete len:264 (+) Transcript_14141:175-966(+)
MGDDNFRAHLEEYLSRATEGELLAVYNTARHHLISRAGYEAEVNTATGLRKRARVEAPQPQPHPPAEQPQRHPLLQRTRDCLQDRQVIPPDRYADRFRREVKEALNDPPQNFDFGIDPEHNIIKKWKAVIKGPRRTPYENGEFVLSIDIPDNYPHRAPDFKFTTRVFHPNVLIGDDGTGTWALPVCTWPYAGTDFLWGQNERWHCRRSLRGVIKRIYDFLSNVTDAHMYDPRGLQKGEASHVWREDHKQFLKRAREWTDRYAM